MTFLAGHQFDAHDGEAENHQVAIVNEMFARRHWPGTSAIGKYIRRQSNNPAEPWLQVVGVIRNEKHYGLDGEDRATVYTPQLQLPWR